MTRSIDLSEGLRPAVLVLAAVSCFGSAHAKIDLRVESRPNTGPIEAFVRVTSSGSTVRDLSGTDFIVTLDGSALSSFTFKLPPDQDVTQKASIIFAQATPTSEIHSAVAHHIERMAVGDYAAIVRVKYWPGEPTQYSLSVKPFTLVDGIGATDSLVDFLMPSLNDFARLQYATMIDHNEVLSLALEQLEPQAAVLPNGPKAIILAGNGRYIGSAPGRTTSDIVGRANALGVPIFTIGTSDVYAVPERAAFMGSLAEDTGGTNVSVPGVSTAYETVASLLQSAYQLVIPRDAVTDCDPHMLEVSVLGDTASILFVRCDTTPDPFMLGERIGVALSSVVISDPVTISGIESPVAISVSGGEFSLGCRAVFTSAPGTLSPGELVCVRHSASAKSNTSTETLLIAGGVSSRFVSTTNVAAQSSPTTPPQNGSGGGGALSIWDLLLGLVWLCARGGLEISEGSCRRRSESASQRRARL